MKFIEITQLQRTIQDEIFKDPDEGFNFFKEKWMNLKYEEKRLFAPLMLQYCNDHVGDKSYHPQQAKNLEEQKICCIGIHNFITDEFDGKPWFGNLTLGESIGQNDIAAVFKLLYDLKYIDSNLEDIEQVIVRIFDLKDNTTISSYFNDNNKIRDAAIKFKGLVVNSHLVRGGNK